MFDEQDISIPIENLKNKFIESPYYFLTEEDVRAFLVQELCKRESLNSLTETEDRKETISVHSEVRWYKYADDQNKRTDIVLIDPGDLRVANFYQEAPSKSFGFNKYWGAIELKLRRSQKFKSDKDLIDSVRVDMELLKLVRIKTKERFPDLNPLYFVICLDRGDDLTSEMSSLQNEFIGDSIKLIYLNKN